MPPRAALLAAAAALGLAAYLAASRLSLPRPAAPSLTTPPLVDPAYAIVGEASPNASEGRSPAAARPSEPQTRAGASGTLSPQPPPPPPPSAASGAARKPVVIASLKERCPNWAPGFAEKYRKVCGVWMTKIDNWLAAPRSGVAPLGYVCRNEYACHGLGDRMAGLLSALTAALTMHRPFRIRWDGLEKLFGSCVMESAAKTSKGDWTDTTWRSVREPCYHRGMECSRLLDQKCEASTPFALYNSDRACLPSDICSRLRNYPPIPKEPVINVANVFGCPLRAILEPTPSFLDFKVAFQEGDESNVRTVREIETIMSKYFVIAVHFRIGDLAAFVRAGGKAPIHLTEKNQDMLIPFRCAATIQSHAEGWEMGSALPIRVAPGNLTDAASNDFSNERLVDGKPVRWLIASDTGSIRSMAARVFGKRVLMINEAPKHIALAKDKSNTVLTTTFAEWYVLGLADKIVMNRYGKDGITEGTGGPQAAAKDRLWRGRVSSFPKTSWVYHLKHLIYDAYTCTEINMPIDGTWRHSFDRFRNCSVNTIGFVTPRPQPHLQGLPREFPDAWVVRGQVFDRPVIEE